MVAHLAVEDLTIENYAYLTRKHIRPHFGHIALGDSAAATISNGH
jgi:hypothetical protein